MATRNPRSKTYAVPGDDTASIMRAWAACKPGDLLATTTRIGTPFEVKDLVLAERQGVGVRLNLHDVGSVKATMQLLRCVACAVEDTEIAEPKGFAAIKTEWGSRCIYRRFKIINGGKQTRGLWLGNPGVPELYPLIEDGFVSGMNASGIIIMGSGFIIRRNVVCDSVMLDDTPVGCGIGVSAHPGTLGGKGRIEENQLLNLHNFGIQSDPTFNDAVQAYTEGVICRKNFMLACKVGGHYLAHAKNWLIDNDVVFRSKRGAELLDCTDTTFVHGRYAVCEDGIAGLGKWSNLNTVVHDVDATGCSVGFHFETYGDGINDGVHFSRCNGTYRVPQEVNRNVTGYS